MEARNRQAFLAADEDRSEVTRPTTVGGKAEKVHAGEIHTDLREYATGLSLLCCGVDQNADHFAPRERADDFAVHPRNRRELTRPIGDVVRPADPGRRVRLPLCG